MTAKKLSGRQMVAILLFIAAALTLVPVSSAREVSLLGYRALCSFSPVSTLILAGLGWLIIYYSKNQPAGKR